MSGSRVKARMGGAPQRKPRAGQFNPSVAEGAEGAFYRRAELLLQSSALSLQGSYA